MGLSATWVQLARMTPPSLGQFESKKPRTTVASGKAGAPTRWWYMESLSAVFTSFHTDKDRVV